jgi:hypothetical protein
MKTCDLLDHVPQLVKAYGKWPSYLYLLLATSTGRRVIFGGCALLILKVFS